ncbi:MAG: MFS transporter [Lentisphaeria bacterium]|nr:MFS transporter [Lentisphaeria bacterium]
MTESSMHWKRRYASILSRKRTFNAVLPAVLLALSVGQIYAFTIFSTRISEYINVPQPQVQFAFSLGIFFLGMGAAFFGKIVEKNIRLSAYVGTALFLCGLIATAIGINMKSKAIIYLGYGFLTGLGTGVIYITPVKTLMLWFQERKALAAAVPIISFGLGSSLCTLIDKSLQSHVGITRIFFVLAAIYAIPMIASAILLRKPAAALRAARRAEEAVMKPSANAGVASAKAFSYGRLLSNGWFMRAWLFMFLNISCGLSLIPLSKQFMEMDSVGYSAGLVTLIITGCGLMNGAGRLIFAWWSDHLPRRTDILLILLAISVGVMCFSFWPPFIGVALLIINSCYGAGFSTIPAVLADHFGMDNISKIHGAVLSAWGVAGLVGNQVSLRVFGAWGFCGVVAMLAIFYALNMLNVWTLRIGAKQSAK